jgi:putative spermidine/putrescine transport system substrate-binding protein
MYEFLKPFVCTVVAIFFASLFSVSPTFAAEKGEGHLSIIAWPGYIERGDTDKTYDWVTEFENSTGCQVTVKTAGTSDEMASLMNKGGYDLVTASGDASLRLVAGKKVQPIDITKIPSWRKVDKRLQNAPWHTVNGVHYGVPFQWGPNVLMYNTTVFPTPPVSWSVLFKPQTLPDGKSNKGRIQAYDGAIYLADAALYLMNTKPELGIKDPYELDETQYQAVLELLRQQHSLIHRYWHDYNVQMSDFKNEGVVASGAWPFQVNMLQAENQPIASTIPREGATGWADTTMLSASSKNPVCAYKWLEWSLNDKVQAPLAEWFGSNPSVPAACKAKAPGGSDFCASNGFNQFSQIKFWKTPQSKCNSQGNCVPYSRWTQDYIAIMGGR